MNLSSKLVLLLCAALLAGTVLSGCSSTNNPDLTDNPAPTGGAMTGGGTAGTSGMSGANGSTVARGTATTGSPGNNSDLDLTTNLSNAPRFAAGETVTVASSTGSDQVTGPIASAGQPYLIADDGTISLPLIGKIQAAGKTPGELQDEITRLYVPSYYMGLAITVTSPSRVFYVGGEVMHPGPEPYFGETTVTKAIQAAGDFTQFSSHTVWLTRGSDGTRIEVNVNKALRDPTQDPPVFPGDQIHVPRRIF